MGCARGVIGKSFNDGVPFLCHARVQRIRRHGFCLPENLSDERERERD